MAWKRVGRCVEYSFYILVLNVVTFVLRPMTWTVLSERLIPLSTQGVIETVSRLVIFLATVLGIGYFFRGQNREISLGDFYKCLLKKALLPVLGIRLGTDIAQLFLSSWGILLCQVAVFLLETVCLFGIFYFIKRAVAPGKMQQQKMEIWCLAGGAVLLLGIMAVYAYTFEESLNITGHILEKYADSSFLYGASTLDFQLQCLRLVYSIVLWGELFVYFGLFTSYMNEKKRRHGLSALLLHMMSAVVIAFLVSRVKVLVFPQGTLSETHQVNAVTEHVSGEASFSSDFSMRELSRAVSYTEDEIVYKRTRVKLLFGNDVVLRFDRMINQEEGKLYPIEGMSVSKAFRYEFDAIAYMDGNTPKAIRTSAINGYERRDEALIQILESLIEEGYFEAFEYGYAYLLKYDEAFIQPYIYRYPEICHEIFLEDTKNSYLRPEYIEEFGRKLA